MIAANAHHTRKILILDPRGLGLKLRRGIQKKNCFRFSHNIHLKIKRQTTNEPILYKNQLRKIRI